MTAPLEEPSIPARLQRPLAAIWISLGLHGALIALVQVAPPPAAGGGGPVIEARLVTPPPVSPRLTPLEPAGGVPVAPEPAVPETAPDTAQPAAADAPVSPAPHATAPSPPDGRAPEEGAAEPSPAALSSGVDLTYYSARELDVQPRALAEIATVYPEPADRQRLSGRVILQLKIEADGRVVDATVVRATPPGIFDAATVEAFEQARFAPAIKDGQPVRAQILIEVSYDWAGRPLTPDR